MLISDTNDSTNHTFPSITATRDGHFLIAWTGHGVLARIYHYNDYFVTDQLTIYDSYSSWNPCVASSDGDNTFLIHWWGGSPLMCQKISTSGQLLGQPTVLGSNSADSLYGSGSYTSNIFDNHLYTTFMQYRINDSDNLLQKYDLNYTPIGDLVKVHDDTSSSWQNNPLVYSNKQGQSIVLWIDRRNGRYDLYAQVYDNAFNPVGENILINDVSSERWFVQDKAVRSLSDGTFIVAFTGSGRSTYDDDVYLQLVNPQGQKKGVNKLVKKNYSAYNVVFNVNENDEILICWYSSGYSASNAFLRIYDKNLSVTSPEKHFLKYKQNFRRTPFALSVNEDFNLLLTWCNYNTQTNEFDGTIYGQFYDETGIEISPKITVATYSNSEKIYSIDNFSTDSRNYIVTWFDSRRMYIKRTYANNDSLSFTNSFQCSPYNYVGPQIIAFQNHKAFITWTSGQNVYGYFFNDNKQRIQAYQLHQFKHTISYWNEYFNSNSVDIFEDKLLLAYESNKRGGTGYDIWANVQYSDEINFDREAFLIPANDDLLYQNYPNPFNSRTKIAYHLYTFHHVKITVFDVMGRKVKVLMDQYQEAGSYEFEFDASDLPSGIYYCEMVAFKTRVIKMLLIK